MSCMKKYHPSRSTPFMMVFCSRVIRATTVRGLFIDTPDKIKR